MKALSIRQPWAWLIVHGYKDIENRNWEATYRGPLLIHAAKGMTVQEMADCRAFISYRAPKLIRTLDTQLENIERGGVIGVANMIDCVRQSQSPWFVGEYGFVLKDARPLPFLPRKGALGIFNINPPEDYLDFPSVNLVTA